MRSELAVFSPTIRQNLSNLRKDRHRDIANHLPCFHNYAAADSRSVWCWVRRSNRRYQKTVNKWKSGHRAEGRLLSCIRIEKCLPPRLSFSLFLSPNCVVIVIAFTLQLAWTKECTVARGFSCYDRSGVRWG